MTVRLDLRRRRPLLLAAAAVLVLGAGRAAAVRPISGAGSPEEVLELMEKAVNTGHAQDYVDCLADSFSFVPYLAVVSAYPDLPWKSWGRTQETEFARWMCAPNRGVGLDLTGDVIERGLAVTRHAQWDVIYTLHYGGGAFHGRATLSFERIRSNWYLSGWQDTSPENLDGRAVPTSGELRAMALRW